MHHEVCQWFSPWTSQTFKDCSADFAAVRLELQYENGALCFVVEELLEFCVHLLRLQRQQEMRGEPDEECQLELMNVLVCCSTWKLLELSLIKINLVSFSSYVEKKTQQSKILLEKIDPPGLWQQSPTISEGRFTLGSMCIPSVLALPVHNHAAVCKN